MQDKNDMHSAGTIKNQASLKDSLHKKRITNKLIANDFFKVPYLKKIDDFWVASDIPVEIRKLHDSEGRGSFETDVYSVFDPLTNKEISLIERNRISKSRETGFGASTKYYLVRAKGDDGVETGKVSIHEYDRNMNLLNESVVSDIPSQAENIIDSENITAHQESLKKVIVPKTADAINESSPEEHQRIEDVKQDILNSNFHQSAGIISKYELKQHEIRNLADAVQAPISSSPVITINNIRDKLRSKYYDFTDHSDEDQEEMESLL